MPRPDLQLTASKFTGYKNAPSFDGAAQSEHTSTLTGMHSWKMFLTQVTSFCDDDGQDNQQHREPGEPAFGYIKR